MFAFFAKQQNQRTLIAREHLLTYSRLFQIEISFLIARRVGFHMIFKTKNIENTLKVACVLNVKQQTTSSWKSSLGHIK